MALRSPTQIHNYWGNYATGSLPSSSNVQTGDTAFDTSRGALVVCTAIGPVVWSVISGSGQSFVINTAIPGSHSNNTVDIFAGIYLPQTMTLSATSQVLVHCPAAGRQAQITLVDLTGVTQATFTSAVAAGDEYLVAPVSGTPTLVAGWYNIGLNSLAGGTVNSHGLYLTI